MHTIFDSNIYLKAYHLACVDINSRGDTYRVFVDRKGNDHIIVKYVASKTGEEQEITIGAETNTYRRVCRAAEFEAAFG